MQELSKLFRGEVNDETGNSLGHVEEILFCLKSGRLNAIIVKAENHTRMRIPWSAFTIEDNRFILKANRF